MPLKEKFNVTHDFPRNKRDSSPHRATEATPDLDHEAKAGVSNMFRADFLLGFL